jgi:hypothetical protein
MECLSGDTLSTFHVQVTGENTSGATMNVIIAKKQSPDVAVVTKACTPEEGGFVVQLTSDETTDLLEGTYVMIFEMLKDDLRFKKLIGNLYVHRVAGGEVDEQS